MVEMSENTIVYVTLFIQIVSISGVLSHKWRTARTGLLEQFPQSQYPNLYVVSQQIEYSRLKLRKQMDLIVMYSGFLGGVVLAYLSTDLSTVIPWLLIFSFVQILPGSLSSYWCRANDEAMSRRFPSSVRRVSLTSRKLADYVSAKKLYLATLMFFLMIVFSAWALISGRFGGSYFKGGAFILLGMLCTFYLAIRVFRLLYGKKTDHFMKPQDRSRLIASRAEQLVLVMILYSIILLGMTCFAVFNFSVSYLFVFTSISLQILLFLSLKRPVETDRRVYR